MNLNDDVGSLPNIGPSYENKLNKLGIKTVGDLLSYVPKRYLDFSFSSKIRGLKVGDIVSVTGTMVSIKNIFTRRGIAMQIGQIEDETGKLTVVWFNQGFLTKVLYPGKKVNLGGKIDFFSKKIALISPEYEIINETHTEAIHTSGLIPMYAQTAGISSKWLRAKIKDLLDEAKNVDEIFPKEILAKYKLEPISRALKLVHFPEDLKKVEKGKKRLAFEEVVLLHLQSLERKTKWENSQTAPRLELKKEIQEFYESLPFTLTAGQEISIQEILSDIEKGYPMNRLLQGDVGSGKTVVAAAAAFVAFLNGYQSIFMAPTQILAEQHYQTLSKLFEPFKLRLSLVTSDKKISDVGRSDIFIGTHSLIQKKVKFERVGFVVIDEQHRFGVEQRNILTKKSRIGKKVPHILTMTATPIPRTIALTFYGDLDVSILREMPRDRQIITTWLVPPKKRAGAYVWIEEKVVKNHDQVFFVCPLIEESESETMKGVKSAKKEFDDLKKVFPKLKLGLLHGKMKSVEKNKVLDEFREGKIDVLVATPVVEVGIDIPNATIIVIEAAERFGLAQLHQLRGRVGRGIKKSYCLLFTEDQKDETQKRLDALTKTHSGFELSELDLKLRGPGEIFGTRQHGLPELKIASWSDFELIKETKVLSGEIAANPKKYKKLLESVQAKIKLS